MGDDNTGAIIGSGLALVLIIAGIVASFSAPCGCYAGTPVKDVPARCTDIGGPTR